ncbi:MAG: DUF4389 domain-containing protein [Rhodoferax sp.]
MSEYPIAVRRNIWLRGLLMILMAVATHLAGALLFLLALIQFVLALTGAAPNARLTTLGRGLGRYLGQVADFVSFATEEPPFPFSDWPSIG